MLALGFTKLYTNTGTATDGTMTQNAINIALNGKASTSHSHSGYASTTGNMYYRSIDSTSFTLSNSQFFQYFTALKSISGLMLYFLHYMVQIKIIIIVVSCIA